MMRNFLLSSRKSLPEIENECFAVAGDCAVALAASASKPIAKSRKGIRRIVYRFAGASTRGYIGAAASRVLTSSLAASGDWPSQLFPQLGMNSMSSSQDHCFWGEKAA